MGLKLYSGVILVPGKQTFYIWSLGYEILSGMMERFGRAENLQEILYISYYSKLESHVIFMLYLDCCHIKQLFISLYKGIHNVLAVICIAL